MRADAGTAAGCRELRRRQNSADVVDHRSDVHVLVSIHAAENPAPDTRPRDRGHATPSINGLDGTHRRAGGQDSDRALLHRRLFGHVRPTGACGA
jgi:hypothetical protein